MENNYHIIKPADFQSIIKDLLLLPREENNHNLVIALQGDLGVGKTTFTQELAKVLGVTEIVTSPTFVIMKQYELVHPQFDKLIHIDAYRFESEAEVGPLGLAELISQPRTIVCIEWPEIVPSIIPEAAIRLNFTIDNDQSRLIVVEH